MATSIITLRNPLGTLVFQETALSNTPVQVATTGPQTFFHFELDNTANAAVTYYKFYNKASAAVVGSEQPYVIYAVAASTKTAVFVPSGLTFDTGNSCIATSTQANATTQVAPSTAVGLTILG